MGARIHAGGHHSVTDSSSPKLARALDVDAKQNGIIRGGKHVDKAFARFQGSLCMSFQRFIVCANDTVASDTLKDPHNSRNFTPYTQALFSEKTKDGVTPLNPECVPFIPSAPLNMLSPKLNPFSKPFTPSEVKDEPQPPKLLPHQRPPNMATAKKTSSSTSTHVDASIKAESEAESTFTKIAMVKSDAFRNANKNPSATAQSKPANYPYSKWFSDDYALNHDASSQSILHHFLEKPDTSNQKENLRPAKDAVFRDQQERKQTSHLLFDQKDMQAGLDAKEKPSLRPPASPTAPITEEELIDLEFDFDGTVSSASPKKTPTAFPDIRDRATKHNGTSIIQGQGSDETVGVSSASPSEIMGLKNIGKDLHDAYLQLFTDVDPDGGNGVPIDDQSDRSTRLAKLQEEALCGKDRDRFQEQDKECTMDEFLAAYKSGMEKIKGKYKATGHDQESAHSSWRGPASQKSSITQYDDPHTDEEEEYVAPPIVGTHVLGELLDEKTKELVVRDSKIDNAKDAVEDVKNWTAVIRNGKEVYRLL